MTTQETLTVLSRARLREYVAGLDDAALVRLAVRINGWRTRLEGTEYDATRRLLITALAEVSSAFGERGLRGQWGRVWLAVWQTLALDGPVPPAVVRQEVAAWAERVAERRVDQGQRADNYKHFGPPHLAGA